MRQVIEKAFFALLRFEISKTKLCDEQKNLITPEILPALYKLSKKHDLAHLIGNALEKNKLLPDGEIKKQFLHEICVAVYRVEQLKYEYEQVCIVLEELRVDYMPLKGSVIRDYYPEPWMRTSADVDILIHKDDLDKIIEALMARLTYKQESIGAYDAVVISPTGFHIELHFDLIARYNNKTANDLLANVWEHSDKCVGSFKHIMHDEYFYYYHLAHMARHFVDGGCGVRPYVDLWFLNNSFSYDKKKRDKLLENGKLIKFARSSEQLSKVWIESEEHVEGSILLEKYLLTGGVYGNKENKVSIKQGKSGNRFKYFLSRIFMPIEEMQHRYHILKKHKCLYPFMVIRRCFEVLLNGDSKRIKNEIKLSESVSEEKKNDYKKLLDYVGL